MELGEKIQALRKAKNLTQEELAEFIFVSRTAVSKWESGRGYPGIDSLKALSSFFGVSVDELLSGEELLDIAEQDSNEKQRRLMKVLFGLFDCGAGMLLFLPLFGQNVLENVASVSLFALDGISLFLKVIYIVLISAMALFGVLTLALQNCASPLWTKSHDKCSLSVNALGVLLFIITRQPYAGGFLFIFFLFKVSMYVKMP